VGALRLLATDTALVGVYFPDHRRAPDLPSRRVARHDVLDHAGEELAQYFAGHRRSFTTPLAAEGTVFQRDVWAALTAIPFGARRSYGDIAAAIARPRAVRAVGAANGLDRLSLFVPCHRVVAADGSPCGYAGGVAAKRWLLDHERHAAHAPAMAPRTANIMNSPMKPT
jgi:methylated-DNA-[protein]-cysteine S-methyltransferase